MGCVRFCYLCKLVVGTEVVVKKHLLPSNHDQLGVCLVGHFCVCVCVLSGS